MIEIDYGDCCVDAAIAAVPSCWRGHAMGRQWACNGRADCDEATHTTGAQRDPTPGAIRMALLETARGRQAHLHHRTTFPSQCGGRLAVACMGDACPAVAGDAVATHVGVLAAMRVDADGVAAKDAAHADLHAVAGGAIPIDLQQRRRRVATRQDVLAYQPGVVALAAAGADGLKSNMRGLGNRRVAATLGAQLGADPRTRPCPRHREPAFDNAGSATQQQALRHRRAAMPPATRYAWGRTHPGSPWIAIPYPWSSP